MLKFIILLYCLSFPVHASDAIKIQWPDKPEIKKTESIGFDSYVLYFKSKITNVYFDSGRAAVLLSFENKKEMSFISPTNNNALNEIKASTYFYYENNKYTAYLKINARPKYNTAVLIPKAKNDFVTDLIIAGYYDQSDIELILSLL